MTMDAQGRAGTGSGGRGGGLDEATGYGYRISSLSWLFVLIEVKL